MEKDNKNMENLNEMEELMEMQESVENYDEKHWGHNKCKNCGKVNIFTRNLYLDINCCKRKKW